MSDDGSSGSGKSVAFACAIVALLLLVGLGVVSWTVGRALRPRTVTRTPVVTISDTYQNSDELYKATLVSSQRNPDGSWRLVVRLTQNQQTLEANGGGSYADLHLTKCALYHRTGNPVKFWRVTPVALPENPLPPSFDIQFDTEVVSEEFAPEKIGFQLALDVRNPSGSFGAFYQFDVAPVASETGAH